MDSAAQSVETSDGKSSKTLPSVSTPASNMKEIQDGPPEVIRVQEAPILNQNVQTEAEI